MPFHNPRLLNKYCQLFMPNRSSASGHADASSESRKTWQSLARLKAASSSTGFRPRSLPTGNQSWTTALLPPPSLSSAASQAFIGNKTTTITLSPTVEEESSNPQLHSALSPIASGSSSVSYAPKSSPSTYCGGGGPGGARVDGMSISADQSPFDADMIVANGLSVNFLADVDQRLQLINRYIILFIYIIFHFSQAACKFTENHNNNVRVFTEMLRMFLLLCTLLLVANFFCTLTYFF
jgi:hypothetical protein